MVHACLKIAHVVPKVSLKNYFGRDCARQDSEKKNGPPNCNNCSAKRRNFRERLIVLSAHEWYIIMKLLFCVMTLFLHVNAHTCESARRRVKCAVWLHASSYPHLVAQAKKVKVQLPIMRSFQRKHTRTYSYAHLQKIDNIFEEFDFSVCCWTRFALESVHIISFAHCA